MKRSKYSFHDFSAKHTPSATLNFTNEILKSIPKAMFQLIQHKRVKREYVFIDRKRGNDDLEKTFWGKTREKKTWN